MISAEVEHNNTIHRARFFFNILTSRFVQISDDDFASSRRHAILSQEKKQDSLSSQKASYTAKLWQAKTEFITQD